MSRDREFTSSFFGGLAALCAVVVILLALGGSYLVTNARIDQTLANQAHQSATFEGQLCNTLNSLKALKPPAGNPATNPSRAFDVNQHVVLSQLAADLGCPAIPAK